MFRPLEAGVREDPFPLYSRLRAEAPVAWASAPVQGFFGFWFITRYRDVVAGLKDGRFGREVRKVLPPGALPPLPEAHRPLMEMMFEWMLFRDPPDHGRLRKLVTRAFASGAIGAIEPRVRRSADALLDELQGRDEVDLIAGYAFPLPVIVVTEMLGVPAGEVAEFRGLFRDLIRAVDVDRSEASIRRGSEVTRTLQDYFGDLVAEHRRHRRDNLMGALVDAHDEEGRLSESEIVSTCILLVSAGHEATSHMIGNGVLALLRHPDQLRALRDDPTLVAGAVDEVLRWDSPQQMAFRYAMEDVELADVAIARGQTVGFGLGAGNRDPDAYPDPDRFDVRRRPEVPNLAFGAGIHTCVGLTLARLEGRVALQALLDRFPRLDLVEIERQTSIMVRGLKRLVVRAGVRRSPAAAPPAACPGSGTAPPAAPSGR